MKRKWLKTLPAVLAAVLVAALPAAARTADAVVFADFEGTGTPKVGELVPGSSATWLNFANKAAVELTGGALKVRFEPEGNIGLGNPTVVFRAESGDAAYKYLVLRIKGEKGGENRGDIGGLMITVGGSEGSFSRSLNDREVGIAPPALGKDGNPMPEITTSYQNFVIALDKNNIRPEGNCYSLNINCISSAATLYLDDIYVTDTYPSDAAVYKPAATKAPTAAPTAAPPTKAPGTTAQSPTSGAVTADTTLSPSSDTVTVPGDAAQTTVGTDGDTATTAATTAAVPAGSHDGAGLSAGAVIAIVAGVVVVVGGALAALYFVVIRKKLDGDSTGTPEA